MGDESKDVVIIGSWTYRHVQTRSSEGLSARVHQFSRYTKITEFNNALASEEDIGRFDISMDRLSLVHV